MTRRTAYSATAWWTNTVSTAACSPSSSSSDRTCSAYGRATAIRRTISISSAMLGCPTSTFIRNRSRCASGSGYTPSDSIGFCVASTRNGRGSGYVVPPMLTCRSAITSSSADCTFAGARLISSASTRFANTGPSSTSNASCDGR